MSQGSLDHAKPIQEWVRDRFRLESHALVMVGERPGSVPGGPPLETLIVFWPADGQRRHLKLFKPIKEVNLDDLPPWWMLDALADLPEDGCGCC